MTAASQAGRAPRPAALPPRPYRFPAFERRRLENGIRLILAPVRKLPLVTACVVVEAGAVADPTGREGVAQLTADLLLEGTAAQTGAELAERFERLGATVEAQAEWDVAVVTLTAMRDHFHDAARLLGDVLRAPSFPEREVDRLRSEHRAELLRRRAEPRALADDMFARVVYADTSRFARPLGGIEPSVVAITRADIQRFYEDRYRADGLTVVIAGDLGFDAAERLARAAFGDWAHGGATPARANDVPARAHRAVHVVSKPDAQQAELRVGHTGMPRSHPDYYGVVVMNAILGGLFSSRINLSLRERHGYTYGAFSHFEWRRQAGPFRVSTAVQTEMTGPAVAEVIAEIDRIRDTEVDVDELSLATSYLAGIFPIRFETTESIADALAMLATFGLPDDFHDTYRDRIRSTTAADVLRAAREHLRPGELQVLVVGDVEQVRDPLARLGAGPVAVYDAGDLDA